MKQGKTQNRLIITWKDYSPKQTGTERESLRCTSAKGAEKILSKRPKKRIFFATYHNEKGEKQIINFNTKETISQI